MFNMAERWGTLSRQESRPVGELRKYLQFRTLSEDEEQRLLAASPPYLRELVLFAINTGLRCGDMFDLKWQEVDFGNQRIALTGRHATRWKCR